MIKLEPILPPIELRRTWLIFFSEGQPGFWRFLTRKGFRHVDAAAYFADEDRWIFVIPERKKMLIEVKKPDDAGGRLTAMLNAATTVVRFNGQEARKIAPVGFGCVAIIKALTGIKSRALHPRKLFTDLVAQGAEVIDVPIRDAGSACGRSGSGEAAGAGGSESAAGPDQGRTGAVAA